jgi:hypothetical protein
VVGFAITMLLPEPAGRTLEDVSGDVGAVRAEKPEVSPRFTNAS